jgi:hypothetical protein
MVQRATLYSLICLFLLAAFWGVFFVRVRARDLEAYRRLQIHDKIVSSQALLSETYQQRKDVKKDIFFVQEDQSRLHYRIQSRSSLLTVHPRPKEKGIDLNEKLHDIQCAMQEKLYVHGETPMQQIRVLHADEGFYNYSSQTFQAQSVALSLFRLAGQELPQEVKVAPFLKGVAEDVSFSVSGKTPSFQAHHFKAQLNNWEKP